jgi:hypothetical protein
VLRARVTHAATVGAIAGMAAYANSPSLHDAPVRSLLFGALVAGLSGGAGAVIRRRSEGKLPAGDLCEVLTRLSALEAQVHQLTSLVTALLGEWQLRAEREKGRR